MWVDSTLGEHTGEGFVELQSADTVVQSLREGMQ